MAGYFKLLQSEDAKVREAAAAAWFRYEMSVGVRSQNVLVSCLELCLSLPCSCCLAAWTSMSVDTLSGAPAAIEALPSGSLIHS